MFLKQTLSHIIVSQNGSYVVTLHKNTQIRVPESGHATVKYFTETAKFKGFLKLRCLIFSFLKVVLFNKYD